MGRSIWLLGMSTIIFGEKILWTLIRIVIFSSLWLAWDLMNQLVFEKTAFAPLAKNKRVHRSLQAMLSVVISLCLFWVVNQDYLFISSVFPLTSPWLGCSMLCLSFLLLLSALFPSTEAKKQSNEESV